MRGVFLDRGALDRGDVDLSPLAIGDLLWTFHDATTPAELAARIADAQLVITNKVLLNAAAFAAAPELKLVCVSATGTNNVDLAAARAHGVAVCNVRAYATPSVAEHVFGMLLALCRHLPGYREAVRRGRWQEGPHFCFLDYPIVELRGKTLGIVGYGELGRAVARLAEAFGMRVLIAARPGTAVEAGRMPLAALLPQVDILSLHCPLTPDTQGLIGAKELGLMKRGALLINTARGGIVDEAALAAALRAGQLGGAGVDVLSREPPLENPLLAADVPNLILTPHIAWASQEARQRLVNEVGENIRAYLDGESRNRLV